MIALQLLRKSDRERVYKMGKIYIIVGKSATGKDTIYQRVVSDLKQELKEIVMYTTRPIRDAEKNGREYYFVTETEYQTLKETGKVIEERAYNTVYGVWRYFTVNDGQIDFTVQNYIMIGTLEAYLQIKAYFGDQLVVPIYVDVETGERLERALAREKKQQEPKYTELCRRFLADEADFSEENIAKAGITKRYYNIELKSCIEEIEKDIQMSIKQER